MTPVAVNRCFLDARVDAKLLAIESAIKSTCALSNGFSSGYSHIAHVLTWSRELGVDQTLEALERARSYVAVMSPSNNHTPHSLLSSVLTTARRPSASTLFPHDPGALGMLGALDQLCESTGIALDSETHKDALAELFKLPPGLRLLCVELIAARRHGSARCPLCNEALSEEPRALITHIREHQAGTWMTGQNLVTYRATGRPFCISGSMLGRYFDLHNCNRWLHRRSERSERGRLEQDIESLVEPHRNAQATRGDNFEVSICELLKRRGLPVCWEAELGLEVSPLGDSTPRIRYVDEKVYDTLTVDARAGLGKFVDLKQRAKEQCGCSTCRGSIASVASGAGCKLSEVYERISETALRTEGAVPTVLFQLMVQPPPFRNGCQVARSRGYLDYVVLTPTEKDVRCTIIDAKATDRVKLGAKVQVAYYSSVLAKVATTDCSARERQRHGLLPLRMSEVGGVWLYGRPSPAPFALVELERLLEDFMENHLPNILNKTTFEEGHSAQRWELRQSCLSCAYLLECKDAAQKQRHVGAIPGLTRRRQLELQRAVPDTALNTLDAISTVASRPQVDVRVRRLFSRHLLIRYDEKHAPVPIGPRDAQPTHFVSPRLAALCGGSPCLNGHPSLTLPATEGRAVHLTLLEDPLTRRLYAWALRRRGDSECFGCVDAEPGPGAESKHDAEEMNFVEQLEKILSANDGATLALYFAERHEYATLMRTLMTGAMRPSVGDTRAASHPKRCLHCLLLLVARPELVHLPQQPNLRASPRKGGVVPSVCVILGEEARRMVSLPTPGPWRFEDHCAGLIVGWGDDPAPPTTEMIYKAWRHRHTLGVRAVKPMLQRRLDTGVMLLEAIRGLCASHPRALGVLLPNQAPTLPAQTVLALLMEPEMSKLAFISLFEARTEHTSIVALRAAPLEQRLAKRRGKTFLLHLDQATDRQDDSGMTELRFTVVSDFLDEIQVGIGGNDWLLTRNNDEGLVDVMRWDDLSVHDRPPNGRNKLVQKDVPRSNVLLAQVHAVHPADNVLTLLVQCTGSREDGNSLTTLVLQPGDEYVLQPRFVDFTTSNVISRLQGDSQRASTSPDPLSLRLLRSTVPIGQRQPMPLVPELPANALAALSMTRSQQTIYDGVCRSLLTLTWGPPGSGKTYFLAATIARLLVACAREDREMRVLVTAFTHSAINNLLEKLAKLLKAIPLSREGEGDGGALPVFKLSHSSGPIEVNCIVRRKLRKGPYGETMFRVTALRDDGRVLVKPLESAGGNAPQQDDMTVASSEIVRVNEYSDLAFHRNLQELKLKQVVLGATVFQMRRISEKLSHLVPGHNAQPGYFDVLVIDEASQMQLPHLMLPLHLLRAPPPDGSGAAGGGRLVVVGDTRQMGPILQNEYPVDAQLCSAAPPPHWSLLRWLWARAGGDGGDGGTKSLRFMLQENHRMTPTLARFTEHVLGYTGYHTCNECGCTCHLKLPHMQVPLLELSTEFAKGYPLERVLVQALQPANSFVLLELEGVGVVEPAAAIDAEADLVAQLVRGYLEGCGKGDDKSVFVVTPRHAQRVAVLRQLELCGVESWQACVDTVEKMQGQERDLVIVCYGGMVELEEAGELDFTYSRERINTAVTRAKKKCILVCAVEVLQPSLAACDTPERQSGYELLRSISDHCRTDPNEGCLRICHDIRGADGVDSQATVLSSQQSHSTDRESSAMVATQLDEDSDTDVDESPGERGGGTCTSTAPRPGEAPPPAPLGLAHLASLADMAPMETQSDNACVTDVESHDGRALLTATTNLATASARSNEIHLDPPPVAASMAERSVHSYTHHALSSGARVAAVSSSGSTDGVGFRGAVHATPSTCASRLRVTPHPAATAYVPAGPIELSPCSRHSALSHNDDRGAIYTSGSTTLEVGTVANSRKAASSCSSAESATAVSVFSLAAATSNSLMVSPLPCSTASPPSVSSGGTERRPRRLPESFFQRKRDRNSFASFQQQRRSRVRTTLQGEGAAWGRPS